MIYNVVKISPIGLSTLTVIHSGTLLHKKRKVTEFQCFWCFVFRAPFQIFSWSFLALSLCYAVSSCVCDHNHPYPLSLSVFSLQRTRLFRTRGEQGHTRREQGLYFEMLRRLDLWLFSWLSRRTREAQNLACLYGLVDRLPIPSGNFERALERRFQSIFKPIISLERSCPNLN